MSKLIKAKGGHLDEEAIVKSCRKITQEVNQRHPPVSAQNLKKSFDEIFDGHVEASRPLPKEKIKRIEALLVEISPFADVKRAGFRSLPSGDCQKWYYEVDTKLQSLGIWLVPEGQLEGFLRTGARKGNEWIKDALSRNHAEDVELESVRAFIQKVFA